MMKEFVQMRRWVVTVAILASLAAGAILYHGFTSWTGQSVLGAMKFAQPKAGDSTPVTLGNFANGFSAVLKPALPAVVNIRSSKVVKNPGRNGFAPFFNDPFFRQFFGDQFGPGQQPHSERAQSLGSGVIVSPDGIVLTNNHVIDGASDIQVFLSDKREFKAKLLGTDPKTDIAVLKIDAKDLPSLPLGESSSLQVGDLVFAIGDPFGIGETATMGIVSATGRGGLGIEDYEDFIQTDASINPGNSGGALIDLRGNLVGINTAILTGGTGGNQGVGFAIPISMVRNVENQILTNGKVVRGYLGIYIQDLTPELARQFGLNQGGGVLVGDVSPDTPASRAGIKKGDVILELNGTPVNSRSSLQVQISQTRPGTPVNLKIWRDGKTQNLTVNLGELPEKAAKATPGESSGGALEGVEVENLTSEIAQELNLPAGTRGVVVDSVDPSSVAASQGLNRGDVIQEINHRPINNVEDYRRALSDAAGKPILLVVNHGGITSYMVIEPR